MKSLKLSLFSLLLTVFLCGCEKVEGPGGSSSIVGKIYIIEYNQLGNIADEYYAQDFDVFIIYGDDGVSFDDDVKTSHDGSFKFDYLEKGNYQIFVYEKCKCPGVDCCPGGKRALITSVEITDKKSTIDVGTIIVTDRD